MVIRVFYAIGFDDFVGVRVRARISSSLRMVRPTVVAPRKVLLRGEWGGCGWVPRFAPDGTVDRHSRLLPRDGFKGFCASSRVPQFRLPRFGERPLTAETELVWAGRAGSIFEAPYVVYS